mgnify:CR=1 FL=1
MRHWINQLENVVGLEIYPIISFAIFFTFFIGLSIYVFRMKKNKIEVLKNIPLEEENESI